MGLGSRVGNSTTLGLHRGYYSDAQDSGLRVQGLETSTYVLSPLGLGFLDGLVKVSLGLGVADED